MARGGAGPAPEASPPAGSPGRGAPLLRRLPLLVVAAAGLWLWRSPLFPQERTFVWDRPTGPSVASAEVQLWRADALLARVEWPDASAGALTQTLSLRAGPVRVVSVVRFTDGRVRQLTQVLALGADTVVHAPLVPPVRGAPDRTDGTGSGP